MRWCLDAVTGRCAEGGDDKVGLNSALGGALGLGGDGGGGVSLGGDVTTVQRGNKGNTTAMLRWKWCVGAGCGLV